MDTIKRYWRRVLAIIAVIAGIGGVKALFGDMVQQILITGLLVIDSSGNEVPLPSANYLLPDSYIWVVTTIVVLFIASIVDIIWVHKTNPIARKLTKQITEKESEISVLNQNLDLVRNEYADVMNNSYKVVHQLYRQEEKPRHHICEMDVEWNIKKNGDTTNIGIFKLKGLDEPANFWEHCIVADDESDAISYLRPIKLNVEDLGETDVTYLPFSLTEREKKLTIYYLPQIAPDEARTIRISYNWPGLAKRLLVERRLDIDWNYKVKDATLPTKVRVKVVFDPAFTNIEGVISGISLPNASLNKTTGPLGETTWEYYCPNCSFAGEDYRLTFTSVS